MVVGILVDFLNSPFYKYVYSSAVISCGLCLGFFIVGKYVYTRECDIEEVELSDEAIREQELCAYYKKYDEEYDDLEDIALSDDEIAKLKNSYLIEDTPKGIVKMYYCSENESFIYWSADTVSYKLLEAVSKKYVIDFDCKAIHIDMSAELKRKQDELTKAAHVGEDDAVSGDGDNDGESGGDGGEDAKDDLSSVFVTFKKNAPKKQAGGKKEKPTSVVVVCDKANRYSYRGKYDENKNVNVSVNDSESVVGAIKPISIADFLKSKQQFYGNYMTTDFETHRSHGTANTDVETKPELSDENTTIPDNFDDFWRFLNVTKMVETAENAKGFYRLNGEMFKTRQALHDELAKVVKARVDGGDESESCGDSENYDVVNDEKKPDAAGVEGEAEVETGLRRRKPEDGVGGGWGWFSN